MSRIIRFLDYFGAFAVATGLLWLYTLYRQGDGIAALLSGEIFKPMTAISALLIGIAMVIVARVVAACSRMQKTGTRTMMQTDHG